MPFLYSYLQDSKKICTFANKIAYQYENDTHHPSRTIARSSNNPVCQLWQEQKQ